MYILKLLCVLFLNTCNCTCPKAAAPNSHHLEMSRRCIRHFLNVKYSICPFLYITAIEECIHYPIITQRLHRAKMWIVKMVYFLKFPHITAIATVYATSCMMSVHGQHHLGLVLIKIYEWKNVKLDLKHAHAVFEGSKENLETLCLSQYQKAIQCHSHYP